MTKRKSDPVRRNRPSDWTDLPASGRADPAPDLPEGVELGRAGRAWWDRAWRTPAAAQWWDVDAYAVSRRAQLEDRLHAGDLAVSLFPELRYLEAQLGLTAKSRRELRWRIVDDDGEGEPRGKVRRLTVVDAQAVNADRSS